MKRTLPLSAIAIFCTLMSLALHGKGRDNSSQTKQQTRQAAIVYIDIGISQPDVEGCFSTTVGLYDNAVDELQVFPNPGNGRFTLHYNPGHNNLSLLLEVFDLRGARVFHTHENSPSGIFNIDMNLDFLDKGVYFLKLSDQENKQVKQIIIK